MARPAVRFETPATSGVVAWCLEPHDLWVSKAIADRPRDREFCAALLDAGIVDPDRLELRLDRVGGLKGELREIVRRRIRHP